MSTQGRDPAASDAAPSGAAQSPQEQRRTTERRRTNGRACTLCHQRKVRCDILNTGIPCSNCHSQRGAVCQLYEKKKTRSSRARNAGQSPKVPLKPRSHEPARQPLTAPATPAASSRWTEASASTPAVTIPRPSSARGERTRYHLRGSRSHSPLPESFTEASDVPTQSREEEQDTRNLADFIDRDDVRAQEITNSGRVYFIGNELSNLNYIVRRRSGRPDQGVLHFGSHPLARRVPSAPPEAFQLPAKALADEVIEAYFVHVNRGFPIVDESEFKNRYHGKDPQRSLSLLLFNAVCLVGAHVLAADRAEMKDIKNTFFDRAKTIFDSRVEQHREVYLQAALLMTWQCDDLEDIVSNSWHWVGVAVRTAFGMGMHRDAGPSSLNIMDKRQWVRHWWTVFQFDVVVSASYGRPQAINLDESDAPALEEHHFDGIPNAESSFAIQHTRLCAVFAKVMKQRVALRSTPADQVEAIRNADEALAQFVAQLPPRLQLSLPHPDIWQATLHLTYNNFLILLHRPPPMRASDRGPAETAADLTICGDAAATITSIFESLRARNALCDLWLSSLHVLFTAMVHVTGEARSENPLVVGKALRMYESLLLTLRELSRHWLFARSLLQLFGKRGSRNGNGNSTGKLTATGSRNFSNDVSTSPRPPHRTYDSSSQAEQGFSLRPNNPLSLQSGAFPYPSEGFPTMPSPAASHLDPARQPLGSASVYTGNQASGGGPRDVLFPGDARPFGDGFVDDSMGLSGDGGSLDVLPLPPSLEFLLAGMGNNYDNFDF